MSIAKKLYIMILFFTVLVLACGGLGAVYMAKVNQEMETVKKSLTLDSHVKQIRLNAQTISTPAHDYVRDGDREAKQEFELAFKRLKTSIDL